MREQNNIERKQEVNRTIAQVLLIVGAVVSLLGGIFMAAFAASPLLYVTTGVQVVGMFVVALKFGNKTEDGDVFLYLLIGLGIFLLMFGICVGIGS